MKVIMLSFCWNWFHKVSIQFYCHLEAVVWDAVKCMFLILLSSLHWLKIKKFGSFLCCVQNLFFLWVTCYCQIIGVSTIVSELCKKKKKKMSFSFPEPRVNVNTTFMFIVIVSFQIITCSEVKTMVSFSVSPSQINHIAQLFSSTLCFININILGLPSLRCCLRQLLVS